MTTPARYPTVEEVREAIATGPLVFLETERAMIEAAIDIERERVAKEAGEQAAVALPPIARDEAYDRDYIPLPGGWEVQTQGFGSTFRLCSPSGDRIAITDGRVQEELRKMALDIRAAYTCQPSPAAGESQNSAVCEGCGGTGEVGGFVYPDQGYETEPCPDCTPQNSAVKVPEDVMESAEFLAQWFPGSGLYRDHASAILSYLQSLTHPTETPR